MAKKAQKKADKAAKKLGGLAGRAASALMGGRTRTKSRLDSIMNRQSTDSNNRK